MLRIMEQNKTGLCIIDDVSLIAQDGQRGSLDNMSITSMPAPLAESTVAREQDRLKEMAKRDPRGSFIGHSIPETASPWNQPDPMKLSFNSLNETQQKEVFSQAQNLVKNIKEEGTHNLTESESVSSLGILEVDAMTDLSNSNLLLDKQPDSHPLSLGSSDYQPLGLSHEMNTVKKRPGAEIDQAASKGARVGVNLFSSNLADMHEDPELDQSVVDVHFEDGELELLDQDFSDLVDFDDEHGQGEGQESDEEPDTHGSTVDLKYFSANPNMNHCVGDGEDSRIKNTSSNRIHQQNDTIGQNEGQRSLHSEHRQQLYKNNGSEIDTDDELEAARMTLALEEGEKQNNENIGQQSPRPGLEGQPGEPEAIRFSMMLRQSAEGEIMSSPLSGDGGGGGDGSSGNESDDGQNTATLVSHQPNPHKFAPVTDYQTSPYRPDAFPEEERIRPMGDDLLTDTNSYSFLQAASNKQQANFETGIQLTTANAKLLESWYLAPSVDNFIDSIPSPAGDSVFQSSAVCDSMMPGIEQTVKDERKVPESLDVMQSSLGSFGMSKTDNSVNSANNTTFMNSSGSNMFDNSPKNTNLALKKSLTNEATKQKEMFQTDNNSLLPLEDNFLDSGAGQEMLNADEEEFFQENIFRKDAQMDPDLHSSYRSIVANSHSSWDEYNPLMNASMGLYWATRTENLGTLDGNPHYPRPEFGMDVKSPPSSKQPAPLYRTSGVGDEDGDSTLVVEDLERPFSDEKCDESHITDDSHQSQAVPDQTVLSDKTTLIDSSALMSFLRKPPTDGSPSNFIKNLVQMVKTKSSNSSKTHSSKSDKNVTRDSKASNVSRLPVKKGSNVGIPKTNKRQQSPSYKQMSPKTYSLTTASQTASASEPNHRNNSKVAEIKNSKKSTVLCENTSPCQYEDSRSSELSHHTAEQKDSSVSRLNAENEIDQKQNGHKAVGKNVTFQNVSSQLSENSERDTKLNPKCRIKDMKLMSRELVEPDSVWMSPRMSLGGRMACGKKISQDNSVDRCGGDNNYDDVPSHDCDHSAHRIDTGYRCDIVGHHEPDGTEYSTVSNYLSTDKQLSREHLVGTSDIQMAESRGYGVVSIESSIQPSLKNDRDYSSSVKSVVTSNQITSVNNDNDSSCSSVPSNNISASHRFVKAKNSMFKNTVEDHVSSLQNISRNTTHSPMVNISGTISSIMNRCSVNAPVSQTEFVSVGDKDQNIDAFCTRQVSNQMTGCVSTPSFMQVTNYVPDMSTFEPLRESLSCSQLSPEKANRNLSRITDKPYYVPDKGQVHVRMPATLNSSHFISHIEDHTLHSFRDLGPDISHFTPRCQSTPFYPQNMGSITYVTPSHTRSVFSTIPVSEIKLHTDNTSISVTPCKSSLLTAPSLLAFPMICCTETSIETILPLKNPSPRWLECSIRICSLILNGREVDPEVHSPFDLPRKIIIQPDSEESVRVIFLPSVAGTYVADVIIYSQYFQVDVQPSPIYQPITLTMQAVAEVPKIELITSDEDCIDFGEMTWGQCIGSQFGVLNVGKSKVPLRLVISSVNSAWHCFTFENRSQTKDLSLVAKNNRPSSPALGCSVLSLSLSGYEEKVKEKVEHIKIYCRTPVKKIDRTLFASLSGMPPERILARLDVELDTPAHNSKVITSVILKAAIGVVKLKTSATSQKIIMKSNIDKESEEKIMLKNAGNINMGVELFMSNFQEIFTIEHKSIIIPPHSHTTSTIRFLPKNHDVSLYETLLVMLTEPESQAYELGFVGQVITASLLQGNKGALVFGGVVLGQAKLLKTIIQNSGSSSVMTNVAIKSELPCFQLQEVLSSTGVSQNPDKVVVKPKERLTIHVLFAPSTQKYCTGKLVFRHSGSKFCIALSGYGGTSCIALEGVGEVGLGLFQMNMGTLSKGINSTAKVILKNSGQKAAYVRAVICADRHGCSALKPGNIAVDPNEFVVAPNDCKVISVTMNPSNRELTLCRENKEVMAYVIFYWGDEILRQNYRRAVIKKLSSKISVKSPALQGIDFGVVYMGEQPQIEGENTQAAVKEDIDAFYLSMNQTCLALIAESPVCRDLSMTTPVRSSYETGLLRRHMANTSSSLDITAKRNSVQNISDKPVNMRQEMFVSDWEVQPEQIILSVYHSSNETSRSKKFQILNYANRNMRYELQWPGHMLIVDPTHGIVSPKSSISLSVMPTANAYKHLDQMLWNGTIKVDANNVSKLVQVQLKMDVPTDQCPNDSSFNNLSVQLTTIQSIVPNTLNDAIQMGSLEVRFPFTKVGSHSEDILQFTNISGCPIFWMLSSFAPPYVKGVGDRKDVFRLKYSVFLFVEKSGQLKPNETAKISVCFQPQSKGLYTQYWDIICKVKSTLGKTSATTRVHLVGEAQPGTEQNTALPRGVVLEHPVSENKVKPVCENKPSEKKGRNCVYLTSSCLTFPPTEIGTSISRKIQIGNDSDEQYEIKVAVAPRPPFYIRHTVFTIKGNKLMKCPVEFRAKEIGIYHCTMVFGTQLGKMYLDLKGECI